MKPARKQAQPAADDYAAADARLFQDALPTLFQLWPGDEPPPRPPRPDWQPWVATPPDPDFEGISDEKLIEMLDSKDLKTREKISAELAHRGYRDDAAYAAIRAALRNPDAEVRFRMRACLYLIWKMLRGEVGANYDDLKKEVDKLDREIKRHDADGAEYGSEASAIESGADDLEKAGDADGGKAKRAAAARTRERERKAHQRALEAQQDKNDAEDDEDDAQEDEQNDNPNKAEAIIKRKKEREERAKAREERRQARKAAAREDAKADKSDK